MSVVSQTEGECYNHHVVWINSESDEDGATGSDNDWLSENEGIVNVSSSDSGAEDDEVAKDAEDEVAEDEGVKMDVPINRGQREGTKPKHTNLKPPPPF